MCSRCRNRSRFQIAPDPFARSTRDYLHNLVLGTRLHTLPARALDDFREQRALISLVLPRRRTTELPSAVKLASALRAYPRAHPRLRAPARARAPVQENLELVGRLLALDSIDLSILQFRLAIAADLGLAGLVEAFGELGFAELVSLVAAAVHAEDIAVREALAHTGRLISCGILGIDADDRYKLPMKLELSSGISDVLLSPGLDEAKLLARFLPEAPAPRLDDSDFGSLAEPLRIAREILRTALASKRAGVNVLFYGDTGTGKTEAARWLGRALGLRVHVAGFTNDEGAPASARERLASLRLGGRALAGRPSVIMFDEVEDLFDSLSGSIFAAPTRSARMSKQWFNDLLETNAVPTIWISNTVEGIDPAFLRRFSYAIEFPALGRRQRRAVLERHLGRVELADNELDAVAERFEVSAAQLSSAVATARLIAPGGKPNRATLESILVPAAKLSTGQDPSRRPAFDPRGYDLSALNSPDDLAAIAERLSNWQPSAGSGLSICLYGPSGTGKSEFVKYLAYRMGRSILYKRVSDLVSMWVGQTERTIARAFREAEDEGAVLLLDEADSFLRDRTQATQSWQVTEVNEVLQQLESFSGVVACTTNLWRNIDQAALRRFVFKVELRFLRPDQSASLFQRMLAPLALKQIDPAPVVRALERIPHLTPGDFAAVARRFRAMGEQTTVPALLAALESEARHKSVSGRRIGF